MIATMILMFISGFFLGGYVMYGYYREEVQNAENLEELKIKYDVR